MNALLRQLPKMDQLLDDPRLKGVPRSIARGLAQQVIHELRAQILDGWTGELPDVVERVVKVSKALERGRLQSVINATGVVVHTNLGRSSWSDRAREHAQRAMGYCNVELQLSTGQRGGRMDGIRKAFQLLTGAEDALVVNNCAAAVLLSLTALAKDQEVIVSRGELVEIGGSFRVPDVITAGGARLVEVGTTNRTRVADYAAAVGEQTAMLLRVHPSNFRVVGFVESPDRTAMVTLAKERGVVFAEDVGSGSLDGARGEPSVREAIQAGVDLVMFSGDKLLGGPQAGLILGRSDVVSQLRRHPMYRALRVDKVTLAALEGTLIDHLWGQAPPTLCAIAQDSQDRAAQLSEALRHAGVDSELVRTAAYVGGGALPGQQLPSTAVRLPCSHPSRLARALRMGDPAVMCRVSDGAVLFDLRTVDDSAIETLTHAIVTQRGPKTE